MDRSMVMVPNQSYVSLSNREEREGFPSEHVVVHHERSRSAEKRKTSFTEIEPLAYCPPSFMNGSDECPLQGTVELPLISVLHVKLNQSGKGAGNGSVVGIIGSPSMALFPNAEGSPGFNNVGSANGVDSLDRRDREAYGVTCRWRTRPVSFNK
jgi:hypothetical protein